jgi:hypothetical protein
MNTAPSARRNGSAIQVAEVLVILLNIDAPFETEIGRRDETILVYLSQIVPCIPKVATAPLPKLIVCGLLIVLASFWRVSIIALQNFFGSHCRLPLPRKNKHVFNRHCPTLPAYVPPG